MFKDVDARNLDEDGLPLGADVLEQITGALCGDPEPDFVPGDYTTYGRILIRID